MQSNKLEDYIKYVYYKKEGCFGGPILSYRVNCDKNLKRTNYYDQSFFSSFGQEEGVIIIIPTENTFIPISILHVKPLQFN